MIYSTLADPRQFLEAYNQLTYAKEHSLPLEIKAPKKDRTPQQNKYYRVVIKYFASQIGITTTEAEYIFKTKVNSELFVRIKEYNGHEFEIIRSTADLSKGEMASAISNFVDYAQLYAGIEIPYEAEGEELRFMNKEIERNKSFI